MSNRHPKNETKYKSLDAICDDPRVMKIWDERKKMGSGSYLRRDTITMDALASMNGM